MFCKPCTIQRNKWWIFGQINESFGQIQHERECRGEGGLQSRLEILRNCGPLLGFTYWMHIRVWVGLSADVRWQWPKLICQDCEWGWLSFLCELTVSLTCHLFTCSQGHKWQPVHHSLTASMDQKRSEHHKSWSELWILWSHTQGLTELNNSEMSEWWSGNVWMG